MGIYDRHYIRDEAGYGLGYGRAAGRGGGFGMGMWSITTWLIVICIGVYLVDQFMPVSTWRPVEVAREVPATIQVIGGSRYPIVPQGPERPPQPFVRYVLDAAAQPPAVVGEVLYFWMPPLERWGHFSTELAFRKFELWRFITFQFLHANLSHLLFNMLGLFFFGALVEEYLGSKRYLAFYLLCGMFGAGMYLMLNLLGFIVELLFPGTRVPGLLFSSTTTPLVGASAGIFGILMAGAYLAPNAVVYLFFFVPMQLRTLAYALLVVALVTVVFGGKNAGGEAGHIGGALAGYYFIRHPHHLHGFFDILGRIDPTSHHYRRTRTVVGGPFGSPPAADVDRVLDKISTHGLHSLTEQEKSILREASKRGG
jgi:membrane associated rhomboid family serine protease